MIYSKTASKNDGLNVESFLNNYLSIPKQSGSYDTSPYKFWDYALLLKIANDVVRYKYISILNLIQIVPDVVLANICIDKNNIDLTQIAIQEILNTSVRDHKYDIVSVLGVLEHTKNNLPLLEKISKHVKINGCLVITTDEITRDKAKNNIITIDDLLEISVLLEAWGYEFVSDEEQLVDYDYKAKTVHSLVMKRIGK